MQFDLLPGNLLAPRLFFSVSVSKHILHHLPLIAEAVFRTEFWLNSLMFLTIAVAYLGCFDLTLNSQTDERYPYVSIARCTEEQSHLTYLSNISRVVLSLYMWVRVVCMSTIYRIVMILPVLPPVIIIVPLVFVILIRSRLRHRKHSVRHWSFTLAKCTLIPLTAYAYTSHWAWRVTSLVSRCFQVSFKGSRNDERRLS